MKKHRIHILLVEDESAHAHLILRAFEPFLERYQVTVVDSLHHANICLDESSPDIILTDLLLPDGKGTTLVSCREPDKNIPVVVMTSHGDEQIAVKAIKAGALDYVVKSEITLLDMPHIVERTLREWALILEQQHTHKTLQESEKRFRILFEQAADSVVLITLISRELALI